MGAQEAAEEKERQEKIEAEKVKEIEEAEPAQVEAEKVEPTVISPTSSRKDNEEIKKKQQALLKKFLNQNGFQDVNEKKNLNMFGRYTFPLHVAVEKNEPE